MRLVRRVAALLALLVIMLPLHGLWRLLRLKSPWVRAFLAGASRALGVRTRVIGRPCTNNVLIVANHLSWLDILALGGATGAAFVSKSEVAAWPGIGWLAKLAGTIFISRDRRGAVAGQADQLADALRSGRPAALFPEGTTGDGIAVLPFRASLLAAVYLAGSSRLRVQPVTVRYADGNGPASARIAWSDEESAGANMKRIVAGEIGLVATLVFHPPLQPSQFGDRKALAVAAQTMINAAFADSVVAV